MRTWIGAAVFSAGVGCGDDAGMATSASSTGGATTLATTTAPSSTSAADSTAADTSSGDGRPRVRLTTSLGEIVIALDPVRAPATVQNFMAYVDTGFYDGSDGGGSTVFHRVQPGRLIQAGGLTETLEAKPTMAPVVGEAPNGLTNTRLMVGMARIPGDPDSATSQFYVNLVDNPPLDQAPDVFTVFAEVVQGAETVDAIAQVETTSVPPLADVPVTPIPITAVALDP